MANVGEKTTSIVGWIHLSICFGYKEENVKKGTDGDQIFCPEPLRGYFCRSLGTKLRISPQFKLQFLIVLLRKIFQRYQLKTQVVLRIKILSVIWICWICFDSVTQGLKKKILRFADWDLLLVLSPLDWASHPPWFTPVILLFFMSKTWTSDFLGHRHNEAVSKWMSLGIPRVSPCLPGSPAVVVGNRLTPPLNRVLLPNVWWAHSPRLTISSKSAFRFSLA